MKATLHSVAICRKYLLWDETLLPTPGKVGMQPCSKSSRRHYITKSCWMYFISKHSSSFFEIPSVHPLDMHFCCLPLWLGKPCNLQTPFEYSVTCAGIIALAHRFHRWVWGGWISGVCFCLQYMVLLNFNCTILIHFFSADLSFLWAEISCFRLFLPTKMMITDIDITFCSFVFFVTFISSICVCRKCVLFCNIVIYCSTVWVDLVWNFCIHFAQSTCTVHIMERYLSLPYNVSKT